MNEILFRIEKWAGSSEKAKAWYDSHPISPLGDLTAKELVDQGRIDEVNAYLDHIDTGGYA